MKKKDAGVTTIVVVCVMAVIMSLSLGLFLTASVLMKTAAGTGAAEECRILAVTLSQRIEEELTNPKNYYTTSYEESLGRAENIYQLSLWHYVREEIKSGSWPYYDDAAAPIHGKDNAMREFRMQDSGVAGEIADTKIIMYWLPGGQEMLPDTLVLKTEVTVKGKACLITDTYRLKNSEGEGYDSWIWEHIDRQ